MDRDMRRGAIFSGGLHLAIVLAAIIALPPAKLDNAADDTVSVDFVGPSAPQHAAKPGKVAAAADTPTVNNAPTAKPPTPNKPIVAPPPPPPPPPPSPVRQPTLPTPPAPAPPPPPPVQNPDAPKAPPPPPPHPPQKTTSTAVQPPIPLPPIPQPPAPSQSETHQPHVVAKPVPLSSAVLNTLMDLKTIQKQDKPPTSTYNPDAGGAPDGGGNPNSTANSRLSGADRNAIGAHVRPCWSIDAGAPGVGTFSVQLLVTTDGTGTVREAVVSPQDMSKMGDPIFNAYASRAVDALLNVTCATLPLPSYMLGQNQTFLFQFTP